MRLRGSPLGLFRPHLEIFLPLEMVARMRRSVRLVESSEYPYYVMTGNRRRCYRCSRNQAFTNSGSKRIKCRNLIVGRPA